MYSKRSNCFYDRSRRLVQVQIRADSVIGNLAFDKAGKRKEEVSFYQCPRCKRVYLYDERSRERAEENFRSAQLEFPDLLEGLNV